MANSTELQNWGHNKTIDEEHRERLGEVLYKLSDVIDELQTIMEEVSKMTGMGKVDDLDENEVGEACDQLDEAISYVDDACELIELMCAEDTPA